MARTIPVIETDIDNSEKLQILEVLKDYVMKVMNVNIDQINANMLELKTRLDGTSNIVGHVGRPLSPSAVDYPTDTTTEFSWYYNTASREFKMLHNGVWETIATLSAAVDLTEYDKIVDVDAKIKAWSTWLGEGDTASPFASDGKIQFFPAEGKFKQYIDGAWVDKANLNNLPAMLELLKGYYDKGEIDTLVSKNTDILVNVNTDDFETELYIDDVNGFLGSSALNTDQQVARNQAQTPPPVSAGWTDTLPIFVRNKDKNAQAPLYTDAAGTIPATWADIKATFNNKDTKYIIVRQTGKYYLKGITQKTTELATDKLAKDFSDPKLTANENNKFARYNDTNKNFDWVEMYAKPEIDHKVDTINENLKEDLAKWDEGIYFKSATALEYKEVTTGITTIEPVITENGAGTIVYTTKNDIMKRINQIGSYFKVTIPTANTVVSYIMAPAGTPIVVSFKATTANQWYQMAMIEEEVAGVITKKIAITGTAEMTEGGTTTTLTATPIIKTASDWFTKLNPTATLGITLGTGATPAVNTKLLDIEYKASLGFISDRIKLMFENQDATKALQNIKVRNSAGTQVGLDTMDGSDADKTILTEKQVDDKIAITDLTTKAGTDLASAMEVGKYYIIKTSASTNPNALVSENILVEVSAKTATEVTFDAISLSGAFKEADQTVWTIPANTTDLPEVIGKTVSGATSTVVKNVGKVSDYTNDIETAINNNRLVRFWHEATPRLKWMAQTVTPLDLSASLTSVPNPTVPAWVNMLIVGTKVFFMTLRGLYWSTADIAADGTLSNFQALNVENLITGAGLMRSVGMKGGAVINGKLIIFDSRAATSSLIFDIAPDGTLSNPQQLDTTTIIAPSRSAVTNFGGIKILGNKIYFVNDDRRKWIIADIANDATITNPQVLDMTASLTSSATGWLNMVVDGDKAYFVNRDTSKWMVADITPAGVMSNFQALDMSANLTGINFRSIAIHNNKAFFVNMLAKDWKTTTIPAGTPLPHHHAEVLEVDVEENEVYTLEKGKVVSIGNLQLSAKFHLEIEVPNGTNIADGTSVGGDTAPIVITPGTNTTP